MRGHDEGLWRLIAKRDYPYLLEMIERVRASNDGGEDDEDRVADMSTWAAVEGRRPCRGRMPCTCTSWESSECVYVAVVSKFVDKMEFGDRMDERTDDDAIRFTLDVYPDLREYEYDGISISCDLVQRLSNKRCPLLSRGRLVYSFGFRRSRRLVLSPPAPYVPGEYYVDATFDEGGNEIAFRDRHVDAHMYIKTSQDECPCSCGGWINDPDSYPDGRRCNTSKLWHYGLIQPKCKCDWAREEWKEFRLFECELFFRMYKPTRNPYRKPARDFTAKGHLEIMNEFIFL